jgi:hypothetical protein
MNTIKEPDWNAAENSLVEASKKAMGEFAQGHGAELCSFFAISMDYVLGNATLCLDTLDNSLLHAKRHEARTVKTWDSVLAGEKGWENATYYLERDRLGSYNPHTANFKYPDFATVHFKDWEEYFGNDQLPERPDPLGHVIVLLHKAMGRLVSPCLETLPMSSPFRMGTEFPSDKLGLVVMRMLNWPAHQGPRV